MSLGYILIILLVVGLVFGLPRFGYHSSGYYPTSLIGVILVILVVLLLLGRL